MGQLFSCLDSSAFESLVVSTMVILCKQKCVWVVMVKLGIWVIGWLCKFSCGGSLGRWLVGVCQCSEVGDVVDLCVLHLHVHVPSCPETETASHRHTLQRGDISGSLKEVGKSPLVVASSLFVVCDGTLVPFPLVFFLGQSPWHVYHCVSHEFLCVRYGSFLWQIWSAISMLNVI